MDIKSLMAQSVRHNADRIALVHGDRRLTFRDAWKRGIRLANALLDMGLQPGDRVGVLEDNGIQAADLFQASAIANLVRVPLYPRNGQEAHEQMLGNTGCRVLVVSQSHAHEADGLIDTVDCLERVFVRDDGYEQWLASQSDVEPEIAVSADDFFIIRHTGGTTGKAKPIAYSNRAWLATGRDWFYIFPQALSSDKCLHTAPISHGSGYQYLPIWFAGGCNVMVDHFDPLETLQVIEREKIGYMMMVSTMLRAMVQHPRVGEFDLSSLKCVLIGAAPIQESTAIAAHDLLGDVLYQGYGQTEVIPIAFMGPQQWFAKAEGSEPLRACGVVMPYSQIEIWNEENQRLPIGEVGEIVARADGQMTTIWNDPDAYNKCVVDGWIKTGDIGRIDKNGYVYLLDRADDLIISGGYNIWPQELENVIASHPAIAEVTVVGVPHEKWGESPHAICVLRPGASVEESEIIALVADALGNYKRPSGVTLQSEPLPKSPVGKIKRKDLREPFWRGHTNRIGGS